MAGRVHTEELKESVNVFVVVLVVGKKAMDQHKAPIPVCKGEGILCRVRN